MEQTIIKAYRNFFKDALIVQYYIEVQLEKDKHTISKIEKIKAFIDFISALELKIDKSDFLSWISLAILIFNRFISIFEDKIECYNREKIYSINSETTRLICLDIEEDYWKFIKRGNELSKNGTDQEKDFFYDKMENTLSNYRKKFNKIENNVKINRNNTEIFEEAVTLRNSYWNRHIDLRS